MKLIEWQIDEAEDLRGIHAISIVEYPAIESDFKMFSKDVPMKFETQDKERQIIMGPALIPGKQIYRVTPNGEEYYGFFSKETVRRGMELYMMDGNLRNHTFEHQEIVNGLTLVESWIVEDPNNDKSNALGFSVPKGTWMVSIKVNNSMIWEDFVKTGIVKGFSIEGFFTELGKVNNSKEDPLFNIDSKEMKKNLFEKVVTKLKEAFEEAPQEFAEAKLADGTVIYTAGESFEIGAVVETEIDGERQPLADGEWELESGEVLVVTEGTVADVLQPQEEEMSEEDIEKELSAIIEEAVNKATTPLQEEINTLKEQVSTLSTEKEDVEKELANAKEELSKVPAKKIERKPEVKEIKSSNQKTLLNPRVAKRFANFNK